jgi:PKD repeat protein
MDFILLMYKPNYMRKLFIIIVLALLTNSGSSQITIDQNDMPSLNDTVRFSTTNQDLLSLINQSGANQTWDATVLKPNFQDIARFRTPFSINILYAASFGSSTFGTQGSGFAAGLVQASEVYQFYKKSNSSYVVDGRGFSVQSIPLSQTWKDTIFHFPLAFGDSDSSEYVSTEANAVIASIRTTGKRVYTVDGWGSITTPFGTFDCIRVKSTIRTTDTVKTAIIPIPFPVTQNITEYKWLAKGQKIPILEVIVTSGAGGQMNTKYRDITRPEAFANLARFTANKTQFQVNSNTDTCTLNDNSIRVADSRVWTITPNTFQFVGGTNANSQRPKIFFTQSGVYTVKLKVNYQAGSDDTTRIDYINVAEGPIAKFTADNTFPNTSSIVQFTDSSDGSPTNWAWTFSPNTVSFVGATSATSQNPKVIFDEPAIYTVSLRVTNSIGNNTQTRNNYITVFMTGLDQFSEKSNELLLYPNPANGILNIKSTVEISAIELYNLEGRLIMHHLNDQLQQNNTLSINTQELTNGLYLLKTTDINGISNKKLIGIKH